MKNENELSSKEAKLSAAEESLRSLKATTGVKAGAVRFIGAASEKSAPAIFTRPDLIRLPVLRPILR